MCWRTFVSEPGSWADLHQPNYFVRLAPDLWRPTGMKSAGYFRLGSEQAHVLQPIAEPNIKNALKWLYYTTNTHIRLYL